MEIQPSSNAVYAHELRSWFATGLEYAFVGLLLDLGHVLAGCGCKVRKLLALLLGQCLQYLLQCRLVPEPLHAVQ